MAYRYIGKSTQRKDGPDIVTGKATYLNDFSLPGLLYGKCLRSPHPHAEIVSIDVSKAQALPGVKAILTYKDVRPDWMVGMPPHRKILDKHLRYVGDAVALIAATSEEIALNAIELIEVEYEILPAVYEADEAIKDGAPQLYPQFEHNVFPPGCPVFEVHGGQPFYQIIKGDVKKAFEESAVVIEDSFNYDKFPCPLPPEAPAVIAKWESEDELTLWATLQGPGNLKLMSLDRLPGVNLRVVTFNVGGSYGNKQSLSLQPHFALALAKATRKPVMVTMSKAEQLTTFDQRLGSKITAKVGMLEDGTINAIEGLWLVDTGISTDLAQGQTAVGLGEAQLVLAKTKNWNLDTKLVATNRCPSGVVKGFGGQELKSALIPLVQKAMRELGIDPVEGFKKNLVAQGDEYIWRDGRPYICKEVDYQKAFDEAARVFDWKGKWKGWLKPSSVNGNKVTGIGLSLHMNADAGEDDSEAYVRLEFDGTAVLHCLVAESGMGQRNSALKSAAEILQLPMSKISMSEPDTMLNPREFSLAGSRGTRTVGTAVVLAAEDAKRKLLERAAQKFNVAIDEVDTADGFVFRKDSPENKLPWAAFIGAMESLTGLGRFEEDFHSPNFYLIMVEVEVDLETGLADIIRTVGSSDVGQIIDPVQLKMQYHGGFGAAGTDTAILEGHILDKNMGRILTSNMVDYKWRTFNQFHQFDTVMLESKFDISPFKSIGVGEITGAGGPSAVLMALSNAIGIDLHEYPATPAVILKALGKA
ncbi:MAG: xanthine dehydrogenase family protein molybdopterin-binding subunit [Oscillospiraceae bacterium]|nr:xanthine dehydrogenase family protein molybdopterin-binding subunit [Oscillospiraceae bacterium]